MPAIWSELLDAASKCQRSSWPKCLNLLQSSIPVHFEGLCQLQARCMTCFLGVAIVAKGSLSFVIGHCSLYRVFPVFVCVSLCAVSPLFVLVPCVSAAMPPSAKAWEAHRPRATCVRGRPSGLAAGSAAIHSARRWALAERIQNKGKAMQGRS